MAEASSSQVAAVKWMSHHVGRDLCHDQASALVGALAAGTVASEGR
jgi:hypothetical protein